MVMPTATLVAAALSVSIWRRLNRVIFEYPNGVIARWTIPDSSVVDLIAHMCAADGMKLAGGRGCMERWTR
jgi:hypothetical protein